MSIWRKALIAFLLIAGFLLIADTLIQNVAVYLPIGLAVLLYGLFWLCNE